MSGPSVEREPGRARAVVRLQSRWILRHRKLLLAGIVLLTLPVSYGLRFFGIDVSSRPFFPADDPATRTLQEFQENFRTHEAIMLAVEFPDTVFQEASVDHLKALMEGIARLPGVDSLWCLLNVDSLAEHLVASRNWDGLRRYMLENPRYRGTLVSEDGRSALLAISPPHDRRAAEDMGRLVGDLRTFLAGNERADVHYYLSGLPVIQVDFGKLVMRDQKSFGALAAVLLSLFMYLLFRTYWGVLIPLACGGLSVIWTLSIFFVTGHRINMVSSLLSLVVVVISMANSIHLMNYYLLRFRSDPDRAACLESALAHALPPCFLATLTTVMGFLSLATTRIPAVVDFVVFASLGIAISFLLTGTLTPALLVTWVDPASAKRVPLDRGLAGKALRTAVGWVARRPGRLAAGSAVFFVLAGLGIGRVHTTMDVMSSFPKDSPLREATVFLQKNFIGAYMLEVMVTAREGELLTIDNLERIDAFSTYLEEQPEINRSLSAVLFTRPYLRNYLRAPEELRDVMSTNRSFRSTLAMLNPTQRKLLSVFLGPGYRIARVTVFLRSADSRTVGLVADRIEREGGKILGSHLRLDLTGELLLYAHMSTNLVRKVMTSIAEALCIILLAIGVVFRSGGAVLVSVMPNLLPLVFLFGLMGWSGIPLTVPTSMVGCIVLGLAVDDTIHLLHNYRIRRGRGETASEAASRTVLTVGRAVIFTSLILIIGFGLGLLSSFDLIAQFGFLAAATLLVALWNDLTLLPLSLVAASRARSRRAGSGGRRGGLKATLLCLCLCLAAIPAAPRETLASEREETVSLRMATLAPEGTNWAAAAQAASRDVSEATGGRVEIRWYLGASQGDETTMLRKIREGRLDGAILSMGGLYEAVPGMGMLGLPFLFRDLAEAQAVAEAFLPRFQERFRRQQLELLGLFSLGFGRMFAVRKLSDLDALASARVWVWKGQQIGERTLRGLGFRDLVPLEMSDVLAALQFDMLDLFSGTYYSISVLQWFPYAHYVVPLNWTYAYGGVVLGKEGLARIASNDRSAFLRVVKRLLSELSRQSKHSEEEARAGLVRREGMGTIDLPPADVKELERRASALYREIAESVGEGELLDGVLGKLDTLRGLAGH